MEKYELNGSHRRVLAIRLRAVDEVVISIRQAFDGLPDDGLLLKHTDPVPESVRPQLQALAMKLEERLERVINELELPPTEFSLRRDLVGKLNLCWADLGDARSRALAGYGEVPPDTAAYLDPEISELCRLLLQAIDVLTNDSWPAAEQSEEVNGDGRNEPVEGASERA